MAKMNRKEAEDIAWELFKLKESFLVEGVDAATVVANQASDLIYWMLQQYPKIKLAMELYELDHE